MSENQAEAIEKRNSECEEKIIGLLGLAARAGKLVYGTPLVCDELRRGRSLRLVFVSKGASENTLKRISDKCKYYGARLIRLGITPTALGKRLGKRGELAVAALKDENIANGIDKLLGQIPDNRFGD